MGELANACLSFVLLAVVFAGISIAQNETKEDQKFKSQQADYAQRRYSLELEKAKKAYELQVAKATKDYITSLKAAQADETKAGDLDSAVQIKNTIERMETGVLQANNKIPPQGTFKFNVKGRKNVDMVITVSGTSAKLGETRMAKVIYISENKFKMAFFDHDYYLWSIVDDKIFLEIITHPNKLEYIGVADR